MVHLQNTYDTDQQGININQCLPVRGNLSNGLVLTRIAGQKGGACRKYCVTLLSGHCCFRAIIFTHAHRLWNLQISRVS